MAIQSRWQIPTPLDEAFHKARIAQRLAAMPRTEGDCAIVQTDRQREQIAENILMNAVGGRDDDPAS
jgi:hypothetical protein